MFAHILMFAHTIIVNILFGHDDLLVFTRVQSTNAFIQTKSRFHVYGDLKHLSVRNFDLGLWPLPLALRHPPAHPTDSSCCRPSLSPVGSWHPPAEPSRMPPVLAERCRPATRQPRTPPPNISPKNWKVPRLREHCATSQASQQAGSALDGRNCVRLLARLGHSIG